MRWRDSLIPLLLLAVAGCYNPIPDALNRDYTRGKHRFWTPRPPTLTMPEGDDAYSQGFRDGCNVALGIVGSGLLRMHAFGYDPNWGAQDKDYYLGYNTGNNYCTFYLDPDPL